MAGSADAGAAALRSILREAHVVGPDDLPALATEAGRLLGAEQTVIHLIDYDQTLLIPWTGPGAAAGPVLSVDGTVPGRAFSVIEVLTGRTDDGMTLWVPMLDGTERLGVVAFSFPGDTPTRAVRADCRDVVGLLAELMVSRAQYGDVIENTRRRKPFTLPAEIQWRQLPPLTFVTPRVAISGVLMPTAEVAGDSFDYAVNGSRAQVAIVDAMGHGLEATLLATVAIGALRNARHASLTLPETVAWMDRAVDEQFGPDKFVTAIVGELDVDTGVWSWVNCGHPPALLVREGRVVKTLATGIRPPLGLLGDVPQLGAERLQPDDRLLLYSDGVVEARAGTGEFFGPERLVQFITKHASAGLPAAETLRRLNLSILDHQGGELQDDATTVLVQWLSQKQAPGAGREDLVERLGDRAGEDPAG